MVQLHKIHFIIYIIVMNYKIEKHCFLYGKYELKEWDVLTGEVVFTPSVMSKTDEVATHIIERKSWEVVFTKLSVERKIEEKNIELVYEVVEELVESVVEKPKKNKKK